MQRAAATWERYLRGRYSLYRYRYTAAVWQKVLFAFGMACLTGLAAQIRIPLPWTPVPITGQTFAVLLSGVLLGKWWGGISQVFYVGIGAAGVPWFSGWSGGVGCLTGPTGGYLIGFILAALFLGFFTDSFINSRRFLPMLGLMLFANFVLIHGPGLIWLNTFPYELWLKDVPILGLGPYSGRGLLPLLMVGTIPFIPGDITKAVVAALITKGIAPKEAYNGELDKGRIWRIP